MPTAVIDAAPGATLEDLERDFETLERAKLPDEVRQRIKHMRAKMAALQRQIAPLLATFSPRSAGERIVAEMQVAEGGAWSDPEYRQKFDLSPPVLCRRRKEHRIVFWRNAKGDYFYPRWQFTETGALLPGIQEVLQTFRSQDEWRVMRYFLGARKQLNDRRPLDLLRAGEIDRAIAHARDHAAENTW
jgi:hypothetical protein